MSCVQCLIAVASSSLISFPVNIAVQSVLVAPVVSISNDSLLTTSFVTNTVGPAQPTSSLSGVQTITYTNIDQLTWEVNNVTLTYPTTYVDYLSFKGAAAPTPSCADGLQPTLLSVVSSPPAASFIYPMSTTAALPSALLDALDSYNAFAGQLSGYPLRSCSVYTMTQTMTHTITRTSTDTETWIVDLPHPTTFTTTDSIVYTTTTTKSVPVTEQQSAGLFITTISGPTLFVSGDSTRTLMNSTDLVASLSRSATSNSATARYWNVTASSSVPRIFTPSGPTAATAQYSGHVPRNTPGGIAASLVSMIGFLSWLV